MRTQSSHMDNLSRDTKGNFPFKSFYQLFENDERKLVTFVMGN